MPSLELDQLPIRPSFAAEVVAATTPLPFDHVWYWRKKLPERKGQRCRIVSSGAKGSILVEFEDGKKVVAGRYAVRFASQFLPASGSLKPEAAPPRRRRRRGEPIEGQTSLL